MTNTIDPTGVSLHNIISILLLHLVPRILAYKAIKEKKKDREGIPTHPHAVTNNKPTKTPKNNDIYIITIVNIIIIVTTTKTKIGRDDQLWDTTGRFVGCPIDEIPYTRFSEFGVTAW